MQAGFIMESAADFLVDASVGYPIRSVAIVVGISTLRGSYHRSDDDDLGGTFQYPIHIIIYPYGAESF